MIESHGFTVLVRGAVFFGVRGLGVLVNQLGLLVQFVFIDLIAFAMAVAERLAGAAVEAGGGDALGVIVEAHTRKPPKLTMSFWSRGTKV